MVQVRMASSKSNAAANPDAAAPLFVTYYQILSTICSQLALSLSPSSLQALRRAAFKCSKSNGLALVALARVVLAYPAYPASRVYQANQAMRL